jgi:hypothetical protein
MIFRDETELVSPNGRPLFGIYKSPLRRLNAENLRCYGNNELSALSNKLIRLFRLKRWQYLGICSEEFIFGLAVVDLGYLSNMFCYIFDRKANHLSEYDRIQPLGLNTQIEGSSIAGSVCFKAKGTSIEIENKDKEIHLHISINNGCSGEIIFYKYQEPLSLITRVGRHGFNYTHKEAGIPVCGLIQFNGNRYEVGIHSSYGVLDYTFGYLSRHTFWNWAAGGGIDENKRRIGFNLVAGVNETGFTENAYWINGKMVKTDVVDFQYDDLNLSSPWKIVSNDGKVDLTFYPEGERKANINAGPILSRFHQPFGKFEGCLKEGDSKVRIKQAIGFTEEHEAKW